MVFHPKIFFLPSLTPDKGYNYNTYFKYANEDPKVGESKSEAGGKLPTLDSPQGLNIKCYPTSVLLRQATSVLLKKWEL